MRGLCVLFLVLVTTVAQAETLRLEGLSRDAALGVAAQLLNGGDAATAHDVIQALEAVTGPGPISAALQGRVLLALDRPRDAAVRLREALNQDPSLAVARLDLAAALVAMGEDEQAATEARRALASPLPPLVADRAARWLASLEGEATWRANLSVALVPDSNVNAAPAADTVTLLGLPFRLEDTAQRRTGVGLEVTPSVRGRWRATDRATLHAAANLHHVDYEGGLFDRSTLSLRAGPSWTMDVGVLSLEVLGVQRWYGGEAWRQDLGGRLGFNRQISPRTGVGGSVDVLNLKHDRLVGRDGLRVAATLGAGRRVLPSLAVRLSGTLATQDARLRFLAFQEESVTLGATWDAAVLWPGLVLNADADAAQRRFRDPDPFLSTPRRDESVGGGVMLSLRDWPVPGWVPSVGVRLLRQWSNDPLYDYARQQVRLGLRRDF